MRRRLKLKFAACISISLSGNGTQAMTIEGSKEMHPISYPLWPPPIQARAETK